MKEMILMGITMVIFGFSIGIGVGEEIGWWKCFRAFEEYGKKTK